MYVHSLSQNILQKSQFENLTFSQMTYREISRSFMINIKIGPRCDKTCLWGFANNKIADQPAHPPSLVSAFVIRVLESIISKLATSKFSIF